MTHHASKILVFLAGLSVALWIGIGYVGSNPLGAVVVLVIAAFYLLGAVELYRYGRATAGLGNAIDGLQTTPPALDDWLGRVPAGLRQAVRLRVEGERAPLPAPTLAPYLVGLLVLLGMLGTLLGMMATLRGTGLALENAGDLGAVQNSLAAPVKGLAFAFGTSIAGVAASAMLGLLAALVRRERVAAVQRLDAKIATLLHPFSRGWQREQAFALLQQQAGQMPVLVERLQTMIDTLQARDAALAERLQAGQQAFHAQAESAYKTLASDVGQALKDSVGESARSVGTALQPVVQATMQAVAAEAAGLHENVAAAVRRQLDGVSAGLEAATARVAGQWDAALERQQQAADVQSEALRQALEGFTSGFEQRSAALVDAVAARWEAGAAEADARRERALARQEAAHADLVAGQQQALQAASDGFGRQTEVLLAAVRHAQDERQSALEAGDRQRLAAWSDAFDTLARSLGERWEQAGEQAARHQQTVSEALAGQAQAQVEALAGQRQALAAIGDGFGAQARAWLEQLAQSQAALQQMQEARDTARLAEWNTAFDTLTARLGAQWEHAGQATAAHQQAVCEALARTADEIGEQTRRHAGDTIAEISRLVQTASEAPKAAAEVVAELRQKLSDSMARDTAMLDERNRLLGTLETLLDAVNRASTEQRSAVDALVTTSADLLERVGSRFTDRIESEAGKLEAAAAQITGSAVEVAGLGEAFGAAVQVYGASNDALMERLQQIGSALEQSGARSDEQLAYYVAQAREVVDLSVLSQKQIIEELQQLAGRGAARA